MGDTSISTHVCSDRPHNPQPIGKDMMKMYIRGFDEGLEDIATYRLGGFHPVHLGDILNGRFEVVHKLGSGGYGIVWLCLDMQKNKWRAVKVMTAEHSAKGKDEKVTRHLRSKANSQTMIENHVAIPFENFWIEGPNGRHQCLVLPVLGCDVMTWRMDLPWVQEEPGDQAREICAQIALGLKFLHECGICHGDFRPANILMQVDGIDGLSKDEVLGVLGTPETRYFRDEQTDRSTTPRYCVIPMSENRWGKFLSPRVAIIDFGESFLIDKPNDRCGIPWDYAAPELLFDRKPGVGSDIWSLACTLYEVRSSRTFFGGGMAENDVFDAVAEFELALGPLPESYRSIWKDRGYGAWQDSEGDDGSDVEGSDAEGLDDDEGPDAEEEKLTADHRPGEKSLEEPVTWSSTDLAQERRERQAENGSQDMFQAIVGTERVIRQCDTGGPGELKVAGLPYHRYRYSKKETSELADLLKSMFTWNPEDRISAQEVVSHPWLNITSRRGKARGKDILTKSYCAHLILLVFALLLAFTSTLLMSYRHARPEERYTCLRSICQLDNEDIAGPQEIVPLDSHCRRSQSGGSL